MKLLFLAPQPFFQERGTPIAVRLALQVLAKRLKAQSANSGDIEIDLVTYHEGQDIEIPGVKIHRIYSNKFLCGVGPGISIKKLICDILFAAKVFSLLLFRTGKKYDLVHAVEESVFIAVIVKLIFRVPYLYDMDSSLAVQLTDKWFLLRPLRPIMELIEGLAMKNSLAVVPMCDALAAVAETQGAKETHILRDISLIEPESEKNAEPAIRQYLNLSHYAPLILYIGNLETYQGIDLLLDAFLIHAKNVSSSHLVIIGGAAEHIDLYKKRIARDPQANRVHFLGHRPVRRLGEYIQQATVLAAPRTKGTNTPMKVYSYLHSGKAIVATNLPTHTQVLTKDVAELCAPKANDFADALTRLINNPDRALALGAAAKSLAEKHYTYEIFEKRLNEIYDRVDARILSSSVGNKDQIASQAL